MRERALDPVTFGHAPRLLDDVEADGTVWLTVAGVCHRVGYRSRQSLYTNVRLMALARSLHGDGRGPWRWSAADVDAYLAANPRRRRNDGLRKPVFQEAAKVGKRAAAKVARGRAHLDAVRAQERAARGGE